MNEEIKKFRKKQYEILLESYNRTQKEDLKKINE